MKTTIRQETTNSTIIELTCEDIEEQLRKAFHLSENANFRWYDGQLISLTVVDKETTIEENML